MDSVSDRQSLLTALDHAVIKAAVFLSQLDENFYDGHQTARELISELVFWHQEYVRITEALVNGRSPRLRQSTFTALSARAARQFQRAPLAVLCRDFCELQWVLADNLRQLPDWEIEFPIKKGCRHASVMERVQHIQEHIERSYSRMENARRHGAAWVAAYFPAREHANYQ